MDDNLRQEIGFRIWNEKKSAILLYLLDKSTTWTIPSAQHKSIMEALSSHFPNTDIASAVCIVNVKDNVPIIVQGNTQFRDVIYQYIVYDVIIDAKELVKVKLPDNVRASHFMTFDSALDLANRTPILNYLMNYMKKEEEQCHQIIL